MHDRCQYQCCALLCNLEMRGCTDLLHQVLLLDCAEGHVFTHFDKEILALIEGMGGLIAVI